MDKNRLKTCSILLIFIIVVVLHHLIGYTGHFGYDDLHYAELASGLFKGSVDFGDHYAYRFPVILFTAICYQLFGISDFASSLPALIITVFILFTVFNILREQGPKVLMIGLSLTTFSNWFLFYSDKLMPDIYVSLAVIWALAIIHRYKYKSDKNRTGGPAFLFAFSLLFGFMSKGTIVLILPLLLYLLITDLVHRRDGRFWLYSAISGIVLLALYLFTTRLFTGSLMKRFEVIADNSYLNLCSYDQQSLRILLKRLFAGFFELSIYQSLATGFIFVFAMLFQRKGLRYFRMNDSFSFFLVSAVFLFLSSNFMTISPNSYAPMCLDPRHYLFLVPPASIPAARIIANFMESKLHAIRLIIALACITVISYFLQGNTFWKLYFPLTALFIIYFLTGTRKQVQPLFILLFAAILLLVPLDMISYAHQVKYKKQRKVAVEQLVEDNRDCMVITNEVQQRLLDYYSGFNQDQMRRFLNYAEVKADTSPGTKILLMMNGYTRYLSGLELNDLPYYARNISPLNRLVFQSRDPDLSIYEMREFSFPDPSETPLLSTYNGFEHVVPHWKEEDQVLSGEIKYSGNKANLVTGYSSTFEYPLDSLMTSDTVGLYVQCSLYCYAEDKTSARLIVSIEKNEAPTFWKALEINRYIKAYSNWWPVSFEVTIPHEELLEGSRLKVYVWNNDQRGVFIDDFSIKVATLPG